MNSKYAVIRGQKIIGNLTYYIKTLVCFILCGFVGKNCYFLERDLLSLQDKLEELLIPRIELDAGRKPHIVKYMMNKRLKSVCQFRHSYFERVQPISEKLANKMLQTGYKQPSRFGKWCPVKVRLE